ncbi:MAG: hypothetical protein B7Z08_08005 [Sphingomonadales bacterium 32-68-7]|nr:MAG: hypothetical protein B7Z33_12120 [Sphingomonadales bacterium 12-68-11]OYX08759.1 MAG: hypothetical protein B7Z08_08005 [Sphingomonadales bacterium 32-68-7]
MVSCSPSAQESTANDLASAAPGPFSAEDKRVARALSVGNSQLLDAADSPYEQALLCNVAINYMAEALEQRGGLQPDQQQAVALARDFFAERARDLGLGRGKSPVEIERDQATKASSIPEGRAKAQLAIGCVQRLQNGGQS